MREYKTKDLIIYWNAKECSHSGKCTKMLPEVFDNNKRPWINPDGARAEEIIELIDKCPSGALKYKLTEDSSIDQKKANGPGAILRKADTEKAVEIKVVNKGPLLVKGFVKLVDTNGEVLKECESLVLCRCGKTKNPPFCDGSHMKSE